MHSRALVPLSAFVVVTSVALLAQDPAKVDAAHYKVLLDNASVRVLRVQGDPGGKGVMHSHPDHIAVFLTPAKVRFGLPDGKSQDADVAMEGGIYAPAGAHNPTNVGTTKFDAILVEFKSKQPGTAAVPNARDNMKLKVIAEGPHAVAHRVTADASFQEAAGSKHDYDQIVIALGSAEMSLSIDGKPARTKWARGDAQFIGRGIPHESKNMSGKPTDFIIVAVK